jgi:S-adenosylmethionine hydrolase
VSTTFHGRDIFAPAAARLATGTVLDELGPPVELEKLLPTPRLESDDTGTIEGEIIYQDPFGNMITSIGEMNLEAGHIRLDPWLGQEAESQFPARNLAARLPNGAELDLVRTFSDVDEGKGLAYMGSSGLLEIGVNRGSAASAFELQLNQLVQLFDKG